MKNKLFLIFDMDWTLYRFESKDFSSSKFNSDAKERAYQFLSDKLGISLDEGKQKYLLVKDKYAGEVSIGVEKEFGISRYEYFDKVWSPDPEGYISKVSLREFMLPFKENSAILTAAPRTWAKKVLEYIDIYDLYENSLFTGEPDIRKPNPLAFKQVLDYFRISPNRAVSIGDQEDNDILPAKSLGMKTIIIRSKSKFADLSIDSLDELVLLIEGGLIWKK